MRNPFFWDMTQLQLVKDPEVSRKSNVHIFQENWYDIVNEFGMHIKIVGLIKICVNETY
jgi:hypothetical protein